MQTSLRWRSTRLVAVLALLAVPLSAQIGADFTATPTAGTNPVEVTFTGSVTGGSVITWAWDFGDGATASGASNVVTHTYLAPGDYTVTLTASGFDGSVIVDSETKPGFINIAPAPLTADFGVSATQGDNPLTVSFADLSTGVGISGWTWLFGDGSTSNAQNAVHTYTAPGTYTVTLKTFVGQQFDTLVQTDLITVDPAPLVVGFDASTQQGFQPLEIDFSDTSSGALVTAWEWDFGDGGTSTEQNPSHLYEVAESTTFTVTLTAYVEEQAETLVQTDYITVDPAPLVVEFGAPDTFGDGITPLEVQFQDLSSGADVTGWQWDFGDGSGSTEQNPSHTYFASETTTFDVSLRTFVGPQVETTVKEDFVVVEVAFVEQLLDEPYAGSGNAVSADVDGDGDIDIVFTDGGADGSIRWFENDGAGVFAARPVADGFQVPERIAVGDIDGDGDPDVAAAYSSTTTGDSYAWFENLDGLGTFGPLQFVGSQVGATDVVVVDLDADGDADLLTVADTSDTVAWYENLDGLGGFGPAQAVTLELDTPRAIDAADFDGDGDNDVLAAADVFDGGPVGWYENLDGVDDFGALQAIATINWTVDVRAADLDGDGDPDVLVVAPNWLGWYENTEGLGDFGPRQLIDTSSGVSGGVVTTDDMDADGDLDVILGTDAEVLVGWYENIDGLGDFSAKQSISAGLLGTFAYALATGDFNGNGALDVAVAGSDLLAWFDNRTSALTWEDLYSGLSGSVGTPHLEGSGQLRGGSTIYLSLVDALPGSSATFVLGLSALDAPFKGGVLVPSPDILVPGLPIDGAGTLAFGIPWPSGLPAGFFFYFQHWILDPSGPAGLSSSNGLSGQTTD